MILIDELTNTSAYEKNWYVYIILNNINGKMYIGKTGDPIGRKSDHCTFKDNALVHKAIQKYGKDNFTMTIIEIYPTELEALNAEIKKIDEYLANGMRLGYELYNLTRGGEGVSGYVASEETRKKLSLARLGKKDSEETRKRKSEAFKDNKHRVGKKLSDEHKASIGYHSRNASEETRRKISEGNKGKIMSEEAKEKMSKTHLGESNPSAKLTVEQVSLIRQDPRPHKLIAQDFNVSKPLVSMIKNKKAWGHI